MSLFVIVTYYLGKFHRSLTKYMFFSSGQKFQFQYPLHPLQNRWKTLALLYIFNGKDNMMVFRLKEVRNCN